MELKRDHNTKREYDIAGMQFAQIDSLGRETMMVYPEGNIINRTYDNACRMLSLNNGGNLVSEKFSKKSC